MVIGALESSKVVALERILCIRLLAISSSSMCVLAGTVETDSADPAGTLVSALKYVLVDNSWRCAWYLAVTGGGVVTV